MLNTDLHNPQNRVRTNGIRWLFNIYAKIRRPQKRMTVEDYRRNLRGVNGGEDFPAELLVSNNWLIQKAFR